MLDEKIETLLHVKSGFFSRIVNSSSTSMDRDQRAFTACSCVFKEITLVGSNQGNYVENATACRKRSLKTRVATQLHFENATACRKRALKTRVATQL